MNDYNNNNTTTTTNVNIAIYRRHVWSECKHFNIVSKVEIVSLCMYE